MPESQIACRPTLLIAAIWQQSVREAAPIAFPLLLPRLDELLLGSVLARSGPPGLVYAIDGVVEYAVLGAAVALAWIAFRRYWNRLTALGPILLVLHLSVSLAVPWVATRTSIARALVERSARDRHFAMHPASVRAVGVTGDRALLRPLAGLLREGRGVYDLKEATIAAITAIGGVDSWLELLETDQGRRAFEYNWRLLLERVPDPAGRLAKRTLAEFVKRQDHESAMYAMAMKPALCRGHLDLVLDGLTQQNGGLRDCTRRFFLGIRERRPVAEWEALARVGGTEPLVHLHLPFQLGNRLLPGGARIRRTRY